MFSYADREETAQMVLKYFQERVGIKSEKTNLEGCIFYINSEDLREKYIKILEDNAVPYVVKPGTKPVKSFLFEESVFPDYEIHCVFLDSPDWTDKAKAIKRLLLEVKADTPCEFSPITQHCYFSKAEKGIDECVIDDTLLRLIEGYQLSETSYVYLCISADYASDYRTICLNNNLTPLVFQPADDEHDWGYYTIIKKRFLIDYNWERDDGDRRTYAYSELLSKNFIPFCVVYDYKKDLIAHHSIKEQKSRAKFRRDIGLSQRSTWEANTARVLNYCGVKWKYEHECFDVTDELIYLPDFFIGENTVLEVKGFWDADSRKKVTELQKKHPEFRVLLLDGDMYPTLREKYKNAIPEWEEDGGKIRQSEVVPIVGMKFCASADTINNLKEGDKVLFKREPDNKYDEYAILATNEQGSPIGHVGSDWSFIYATKMDIGMEYEASVKEKTEKVIQVRIIRVNENKEVMYDFFT